MMIFLLIQVVLSKNKYEGYKTAKLKEIPNNQVSIKTYRFS
jgi:hypothetical protein